MTLFAVEGAAGCGKTVRLISEVEAALDEAPLLDGQRVLAVTFMHGARRRLHQKLNGLAALRGRLHCVTIDSFAQRLVARWRGRALELGAQPPPTEEWDACCDLAGLLLEQPEVARWVAASFPIILVDEAQDLKPQRLRMIAALTPAARLFVAADDFQCLDQTLRPSPALAWLRAACEPVTLDRVHRTSVNALLAAAGALRAGQAPTADGAFRIFAARGTPLAAAALSNAIAWRRGGSVAVITPATAGGFAQDVVQRVGAGPIGQHQNGPFRIAWERSESDDADAVLAGLVLDEPANLADTVAALRALPDRGVARAVLGRVRRQAAAAGVVQFDAADIVQLIRRQVAVRRQHGHFDEPTFAAMTVQQAKNREFDGVVVLWPFQVGGDAEHKRRLLYNAITRARRWCTVIVQSDNLLRSPPFIVAT
ncbi:ATP-dependent helicase [Phenylobacterium sp.]|uniref:ATP-dependent helicase n=1 Tax=Phenylobacterium sp. TaxID=1871053 RepID=UPI0025CCBD8B|nr:ATP-dependent helicase [Phenylobacterium sp.]